MNRILHFIPRHHRCPECSRRHRHERALELVQLECERVERLAGGILEFWPLAVKDPDGDEDVDPDDRELSWVWRARIIPLAIDANAIGSLDVPGFTVSELRRLGGIYLAAAECIEAGDTYFPPRGTLADDDQAGDVPAEGGAP